MTETKQIAAINALTKLALKILKDKDYDALSDKDKETVKDSAIDILRQIHRKHREIDAASICSELLQCCVVDVNTEGYDICDNAAKAMNYVMQIEALEEKAMCLRSDIEEAKWQIKHYQELMEDDEKALRDVESEIEAMKSVE